MFHILRQNLKKSKERGNSITFLIFSLACITVSMSLISMTLAPTFQRELQSRPDTEQIKLVADRYLNRLEQYIRENPTLFLRPDATPDVVWSAVQSTPGDNIPPFQKFDIDRNTSFTIDGTDYTQSVPTALKTFSSNIRFDDTDGTPTATITSTLRNDAANDRYGIVRFAWPYNNRFRIMVDSTLGNVKITSRRLVTIDPPLPEITEGSDFKVNNIAGDYETDPAVAKLSDGGFVSIWLNDFFNPGPHGQLYNASGNPVNGNFQIFETNTPTPNVLPSVAGLLNGGFVVTWVKSANIYARLYNTSGNPTSGEFRVNTMAIDEVVNTHSSVEGLFDGGFVVTWTARDESNVNGIYGQRFNASGNFVGGEFKINTSNGVNPFISPSVAGLSDGSFIVIWTSDGDIYGQQFNASGNSVGIEFRVNTYTTNSQTRPSVAELSGSGFVVVWESSGQGEDLFYKNVYGQRYDISGNPRGVEFRINTCTNDTQHSPSVAGLSDGGFVVAWVSSSWDTSSAFCRRDGSINGIFGQRYDISGNPIDIEFKINDYIPDTQHSPSVAGLTNGGFVVTWYSHAHSLSASSDNIFAKLYALPAAPSAADLPGWGPPQ